jgi:hypothetical protein
MAVKKMGFEGLIYYGAAGSTAATQITNSQDITISYDNEEGETTVRGSGSSVPIKTSRVTAKGVSIEWTMLVKTDDSTLEALRVAEAAGNPVALRLKDNSAGKGFDGDVILNMQHGLPLKGEQTIKFTAKPNDDSRTPSLYV